MGDLNCNMASAHFDTNTRLLCEISDIYGLQQLITEPPLITELSSSLIDVIFTNCIELVRIWKDFVQINTTVDEVIDITRTKYKSKFSFIEIIKWGYANILEAINY